ncbi:permease prefix domain 1-containing protein [Paenibacillus thiaminolyticus]|uniref:Permease prefix domain 1-containing protein n=1 Tax=Paenibacillus thiaminolyticus TaxID=49283 RepID=A0AAP9DXN2_PANTH|nr:permease prefix domain 1-containing protein [Paenibacillus thiaminolyticus]MCY9538402.1 permease prefix domain 1-containing protein [Paenibacillus thiaminolyticus]MCY9602691.1 permease prefix domain 1-containing protein [Paenibacillus thiaminolyticus]MCY9610811.1 permease prefix domain 1-containing protein [Paenibacillus thiaminolyticus]MCY9616582.1 permease prefix domain 1-containing protein [Paenibacillus thiaminolyticus]MCY9621418.1 permease prefix domain 1-containing protein [Paenibacil
MINSDKDGTFRMPEAAEQFVQDVLGRIKAKEMKPEIEAELRDHLLSRMEEHTDRGRNEDEAAHEAVRQMGASSIVAEQMNRIHRPRIPWLLWSSLVIWIGFSLFGLFLLQSEPGGQNLAGLGTKSSIYLLLGIVCFAAGMFIDYRQLWRLASWMYGGMAVLLVWTGWTGVHINGMRFLMIGPVPIDIYLLSPFLFLIAIYVMLSDRSARTKRYAKFMPYALIILPVLLYVIDGRYKELFIYGLGMIVVLMQLRCRPVVWWKLAVCAAGGGVLLWMTSDTVRFVFGRRMQEWSAFLGSTVERDSDGGFVMREIRRSVQHAGWFGQENGQTLTLPYLHSDYLSVYLVDTAGWSSGLLLLGSMGVLLYSVYRAAAVFAIHLAGG